MKKMIIKNGTTYNPFTKEFDKKNIAINGNKIVETPREINKDWNILDATNCIIVPGLIDYHIHLYTGCDGGVPPDIATLPNGVTTAVDGGTCGVSNYELFEKYDITNSRVRIKSYLHVSPTGLATTAYTENEDPKYYDLDKMRELFDKYRDHLIALKFRISKDIVRSSGLTREPLEKTIEIAEVLKCKVVVHMNDPIIPIEDVADMLRPGDVFCHMYHGMGDTIIDNSGLVKKRILEARKRGIIFDACNGRSNFSFKIAIPAIKNEFIPDIISTDMSPMTLYEHPVINLPRLLSKYLNMGIDIKKIFDMVTITPAKQIGMEEELGSLNIGTVADIAIFKIIEKQIKFYDYLGEYINGNQVIIPQMTIKDGKIMYRQTDFN